MACKHCKSEEEVKHKQREEAERKDLITRLNRIEGQVRGVKTMVEENRYCVDIVTQVSAIQAALNSFNKELLARHIKTCVSDDIREGNEEAVDELCELLKKLMK
ncbi:MAG: metal-sensing transcriptional repressor [Roseburia sp.]|nr:metal-sensing transcriptional repressor [Roseburia sp.]